MKKTTIRFKLWRFARADAAHEAEFLGLESSCQRGLWFDRWVFKGDWESIIALCRSLGVMDGLTEAVAKSEGR